MSFHAPARGVVLPDLRLIYVPVPKAACTSLLWLLADAAGLQPERFTKSSLPEVTPATTVHDLDCWPAAYRVRDRGTEWLRAASNDPQWLLFSVVRNPTQRLWSAWQSKLLLREPRYSRSFGNADWFPRVPCSAELLVDDFRRFVHALTSGEVPPDAHWRSQEWLLQPSAFSYSHIGRVETLSDTVTFLSERLPAAAFNREAASAIPGRDNRSPLSFHPQLLDEDLTRRISALYEADLRTFGYTQLGQEPGTTAMPFSAWLEQAESIVPALQNIVQRNIRVGHLSQLLRG